MQARITRTLNKGLHESDNIHGWAADIFVDDRQSHDLPTRGDNLSRVRRGSRLNLHGIDPTAGLEVDGVENVISPVGRARAAGTRQQARRSRQRARTYRCWCQR